MLKCIKSIWFYTYFRYNRNVKVKETYPVRGEWKMKTKKSRFSLMLVLVMSIFVISACGNESNGASSSRGNEYDTAMREGKQSIAEKDYAGAEEAFNEALGFKEKDAVATTFLNQTKDYIAAENKYTNGKLEEAKVAVEKVVTEKNGSKDLVKVGKELETKINKFETQQKEYQALYDSSQKQFDAGKLDDAAGTIEELLAKDLSNSLFADLKQQATELKTKINQAQAAKVKEEQAIVPDSKYKTERNSELAGKEFTAATGKDIKTATDEEIAAWLATKNATQSSGTTATDSSANAESSSTDSSQPEVSLDTEKNNVLTAVEQLTGLSSQDNQYYITKESADLFQVEIRHAHTVDGTEISNMVGMFQYTPSTKGLTKMDPITGAYAPYKK